MVLYFCGHQIDCEQNTINVAHVHGYGDFAVSQQKLKLNKSRGQKEARTSFQIADETRRRFLSSRERRTGSPHWQHKHSRLMFETRPRSRGDLFLIS